MLQNNTNNTVSFSIFTKFPGLLCFMSTRKAGDFQLKNTLSSAVIDFLKFHNIKQEEFVGMEQVHESEVAEVASIDGGKIISGTDGIATGARQLFLGVNTADCVPLFFYDPVGSLIGIVHAGWKGTIGRIAIRTIKKLKELGSHAKNVLVAIGPHIGGCCYTVREDRAQSFFRVFQDKRIVYYTEEAWHIDLGLANKRQLIESGIKDHHIDAPITCTSCQNDTYFSFRKDPEDVFGACLGIIGIRN